MIVYNSRLAKLFVKGKHKHYFMLFGFCFTRYKYCEFWEEMELRIRECQYYECVLLALLPSLVLSVLFSWWFMLLALFFYYIVYWAEFLFSSRSAFDQEAKRNCGDTMYMRKRKFADWRQWYGKNKKWLRDNSGQTIHQNLLF